MEHSLAQSYKILSSILSTKVNSTEYLLLKNKLNTTESDALKQLQRKQAITKYKGKAAAQPVGLATSTDSVVTTTQEAQPVGPEISENPIETTSEHNDSNKTTEYFHISDEGEPNVTSIDVEVDGIPVRSTLLKTGEQMIRLCELRIKHPDDEDLNMCYRFAKTNFQSLMQVTEELKLPDDGYYEYRGVNPGDNDTNPLVPTVSPVIGDNLGERATDDPIYKTLVGATENKNQLELEVDEIPIGRTLRQTLDRMRRLTNLDEKYPDNKGIADALELARTDLYRLLDLAHENEQYLGGCYYPDMNVSVRISKKKRFPMNKRR